MRFLSCIGDDPNGHELMKHIQANRVCVDAIHILPSASTGTASICIDAAGENSIIVVGGANALFSSQLVELLSSFHSSSIPYPLPVRAAWSFSKRRYPFRPFDTS